MDCIYLGQKVCLQILCVSIDMAQTFLRSSESHWYAKSLTLGSFLIRPLTPTVTGLRYMVNFLRL
jgi:hypothetical protein